MLTETDLQKVKAAGEKALENRYKGYHCSESVFLAINETFGLVDPAMVRMVTGFHGGGGTHATEPGVDITALLEDVASGKKTRWGDDPPIEQVGHICGALASGLICIGLLYGREKGTDDLNCVDELCFELHRRFQERLGEKECVKLYPKWSAVSPSKNCEYVYKTAAEIAVKLILEASQFLPACKDAKRC